MRATRALRAQAAIRLLFFFFFALDSKSRTETGVRFQRRCARRRARACLWNTHRLCTRATDDAISSSSVATGHSTRLAKGNGLFGLPQCHLLCSLLAVVSFPPPALSRLCFHRPFIDNVQPATKCATDKETYDVGKALCSVRLRECVVFVRCVWFRCRWQAVRAPPLPESFCRRVRRSVSVLRSSVCIADDPPRSLRDRHFLQVSAAAAVVVSAPKAVHPGAEAS